MTFGDQLYSTILFKKMVHTQFMQNVHFTVIFLNHGIQNDMFYNLNNAFK